LISNWCPGKNVDGKFNKERKKKKDSSELRLPYIIIFSQKNILKTPLEPRFVPGLWVAILKERSWTPGRSVTLNVKTKLT